MIESLFPLSTSLWWYPTTYVVFLFVQPFYQKGLLSMDQVDIRKLIVVMTVIWSFTTIIPFFDYGSSNFLTFIMLYAITFYLKKYGIRVLRSKKNCIKLVVLGCLIGFFSIVCMDAVGIWIPEVGKYACYFMRGNFRPLPLLISVGFFAWSTQWKLRGEKLVNNIAKLTFGVYLIHMYPPMKEMLFTKIFNIEMIVERRDMPILAMGTIIVVFVGCCVLELIRRNTFDLIIQKVEEKILSKFNCFASYRL